MMNQVAWGQETSPAPAPVSASPWSYSSSVTYIHDFNNQSDPFVSLGVSANYKYSDSVAFSISQPMTNNFYIAGDEKTIELSDTVIGMSEKGHDLWIFTGRWSGDFALPISRYSREQTILTKVKFAWPLSYTWGAAKEYSFSVSPYYRYYLNTFKTSRAGTFGGQDPLPWMQFGSSAGLNYTWNEVWSASLAGSYGEIRYEEDTGLEDVVGFEKPNDHPYSLDISLNRSFANGMSASVGYSQASQLEAFGGLDFAIYDDALASWYVSIGYSWP